MSPMQHLGVTWAGLLERVERTGRWPAWVAAEPSLAQVSGLEEVVAITQDLACPGQADVLLASLVRLAAVDGGNDQDAAHAVALLLANGATNLARRLTSLSKDVDQIVAGQIWLQIREFPWRQRRRAIAKNILLDVRRAVLRDLGVDTRTCSRGVEVRVADPVALGAATDRGSVTLVTGDPDGRVGEELSLSSLLKWATGTGVVSDQDASILLELASLQVAAPLHGLSSAAEISAVATRLGVCGKTVLRSRDRALRSLVEVREAYLRECA